MPEHLNRQKRPADRSNDRVNGVPCGIDPRDFVGKKFEEVEDPGDGDDPRLPEDFERLVFGRERDPMEMDGETGDENGEVKIDPGEAGEAERDGDRVESIHGAKYQARRTNCKVSLV